MGVWERISSVTDLLKRTAPDVAPVTEACRKGYDVGRTATAHFDGAVRSKAREIHLHLSDDQYRILKDASKNGALYLARSYGAGPVIDIALRSVQERKADSDKERIYELEKRVAKLEKELKSKL